MRRRCNQKEPLSLRLTLTYRHLYYDQKDEKLIQDMRFSGPSLGVTFRF